MQIFKNIRRGKMASKSKDVRIEQRRIFEKKLALRLQQLGQKGISKENAQTDPLVKSLKSKIRETNVRIAAFDKFVQRAQELAKAKAQKLAELTAKKEEKSESAPAKESSKEAKQTEPKPKKKEETADKEPKKKPESKEVPTIEEPPKPVVKEESALRKTKKTPATSDASEPKKAKKQPASADETATKKKATKKKEE